MISRPRTYRFQLIPVESVSVTSWHTSAVPVLRTRVAGFHASRNAHAQGDGLTATHVRDAPARLHLTNAAMTDALARYPLQQRAVHFGND